MAGNDHISELFSQNGCLKQSAIARYIDGRLDEKELQEVLNHLDKCPLCKDAVEGVSGIGTKRFDEELDQIRADFYEASSVKDRKHRLRVAGAISVAASVVIILGVLFFYRQTSQNVKNTIAQSVKTSEKIKEQTLTGEETAPLDEAARPVQPLKEESRTTGSVSAEVQSPGDAEEAKTVAAPTFRESDFTEEEISHYELSAEPVQIEKSMELTEQQSVTARITSGATAADKKRSGSVENTLLMQEAEAPEEAMALPAGYDLSLTGERFTFRGGDVNEFIKYIQEQLNKKDQVLKKMGADSILVSFAVDTTGRPVNVKIMNRIDPETYREIIRLIESSPDWLPGEKNGITVGSEYIISVRIPPVKGE
ncbi:MAG: zf-HC2 domain-containing protein [Bacteroidales bacterium]|nr:zf-HC2 domain-containing protein [Bacteroidales bacterium]